MPLTLITDPNDYQLSKNPIVAEVETDSYVQIVGVAATLTIKADNADGANALGGTIAFVWPLDSVIFTVVTTPDDSGYQVSPKGGLSDSAYATLLLAEFSKNYKLTENYIIAVVGSSLSFTARVAGLAYNLTSEFTSLNFGLIRDSLYISAELDTAYAENYKMHADLWMESRFLYDDYTRKGSLELDPLNNICKFDFKTEVNANLTYDLPTFAQNVMSNCTSVIKRFYLRYFEKYGSPVAEREINTTTVGFALKAGIPTEEFVGSDNHMLANFVTPKRFLTNQPRTKKVTETQQEFLYWMVTDKINGHKLKTTVYFNDGHAPVEILGAAFGTATYQIFCIPVGFTALNLVSTNDFVNVTKYTVQVVNALTPTNTSEVFTFYCDQDYYHSENYMLFSTSCGGVDTLRLTGVTESNFEVEKETIQITNLYDTPVINGQFAEVSHLKSDRYKINTGWITKEASDWLEDLFMAEKKFIILDGQFIPFTISTNAIRKYDTLSTLYSYEFDYITSFKNRAPKSQL